MSVVALVIKNQWLFGWHQRSEPYREGCAFLKRAVNDYTGLRLIEFAFQVPLGRRDFPGMCEIRTVIDAFDFSLGPMRKQFTNSEASMRQLLSVGAEMRYSSRHRASER